MRVVVTGGAGFLGSHMCTRLIDDGHEVVCLDNLLTGKTRNVAHLDDEKRFTMRDQDVTSTLDVPGDIDLIYHMASPASPIDYLQLPIETLEVGALGTRATLALAREKGARMLLASTSESYGDPLVHPQPETYWGNVNPVGPRSVYDEAKRFAEALTMANRRSLGVDTTIARIFNTYGPRMRPDDGRAVPAFMSAALRGEALVVHGDGKQTRSLCYVDDLIEGLVRLASSTLAGPVNIGNQTEMTMLELARLVLEVTGSASQITFGPRPVDDPQQRCPDISLARAELGWEPVVSPAEGLAATARWFEKEVGAA